MATTLAKALSEFFKSDDPNPPKLDELGAFLKSLTDEEREDYAQQLRELGYLET